MNYRQTNADSLRARAKEIMQSSSVFTVVFDDSGFSKEVYASPENLISEAHNWLNFRRLKVQPVGYYGMDRQPWHRKLCIWPQALWYGLIAHRFYGEKGLFG